MLKLLFFLFLLSRFIAFFLLLFPRVSIQRKHLINFLRPVNRALGSIFLFKFSLLRLFLLLHVVLRVHVLIGRSGCRQFLFPLFLLLLRQHPVVTGYTLGFTTVDVTIGDTVGGGSFSESGFCFGKLLQTLSLRLCCCLLFSSNIPTAHLDWGHDNCWGSDDLSTTSSCRSESSNKSL